MKATQRLLVLRRLGDYRLTVPAPSRMSSPARGSESTPGLRKGAVLWAGFSPGHKVLAANATLDPRRRRALLPLRVERLRRLRPARERDDDDGDDVHRERATRRSSPRCSTRYARNRRDGRWAEGSYVKVTGSVRDLHVRVRAPLESRAASAAVRSRCPRRSEPRTIRVTRPAGRRALRRAGSARLALSAPRRPDLERSRSRTSLTLARVRQYRASSANPDPLGRLQARYAVPDGRRACPGRRPAPPAPQDEGLAAWLIALIAAGSVAAAGGLAVALGELLSGPMGRPAYERETENRAAAGGAAARAPRPARRGRSPRA